MASNFKILVHRNGESLHLKLLGDFDGSSACQVIETMKKNSSGLGRIFVHTNGLRTIYPFGQDVFINSMHDFNKRSINVIFTGENSNKLAPEKSKRVLSSNSFLKFRLQPNHAH